MESTSFWYCRSYALDFRPGQESGFFYDRLHGRFPLNRHDVHTGDALDFFQLLD